MEDEMLKKSKKEVVEEIQVEYEKFRQEFSVLQKRQEDLILQYRKRLEEVRMQEIKNS